MVLNLPGEPTAARPEGRRPLTAPRPRWLARAALGLVPLVAVLACQDPDAPVQSACGEGLRSVQTANGVAGCVPETTASRPRVARLGLGPLTLSDGGTLMVGHDVAVALALELDAEPHESSVVLRLASASAGKHCLLGALPIRHGDPRDGHRASFLRRHELSAELRVPVTCSALVGADDVIAWATFDPSEALWVDARDVLTATEQTEAEAELRRRQTNSAPIGCAPGASADCTALRLLPSAGLDLRLSAFSLGSNIAVLEVPEAAPEAGEDTAAQGVPGEAGSTLATSRTEAADFAPALDPSPLIEASATLGCGGAESPEGVDIPALNVELAIRPAGADDGAWTRLDAPALTVPEALPQVGRVGLSGGAMPDAALRERLVSGDWAEQTLFEVRLCAASTLAEAGPADDARRNNCAVAEVALLRVPRHYGVHSYPEGAASDSAASDYYEIGRTEESGNALLKLIRFRGGFREVVGGHVRLGGTFWTKLQSSLFSFDSGKLAEARAYHDTAPGAPDFVTGDISLLGFATISLPQYDVPDRFRFALNASVNTSASSMNFGSTAQLAPLVSALNWIGKQAQSGGPKFCVYDPFCLSAPLMGSISLTTGLAFSKGIETPPCTVIEGVGCYLKEDASPNHFWANATTCANKGAMMPSNHGSKNKASLLRAYANVLGEPFYLGYYRAGFDYHYLMSQVFFETNWVPYGTTYPSVMPTYWAFLDATMVPDKGACAVQAPYLYTKSMRVDYDTKTVAQAAVTDPGIRDVASRAHVPCQATMIPVCEYPLTSSNEVAYERNELYLQFAGKLVVDASVTASEELFNFKGSVSVTGNLLTATWAATAGLNWFASQRPSGAWLTKGSANGSVAVTGKLGGVSISGEACILLGLGKICLPPFGCTEAVGEWICQGVSLGGLTSILPVQEVGAYFSASFLPFDVESSL